MSGGDPYNPGNQGHPTGGQDHPTGGQDHPTGGQDHPTPSTPSAPSAPAVDPIEARKVAMFQSIYMSLWGEPATEAYLKAAANAGLNTWEFEDRERHKPAFAKTKTYKDQAKSLADALIAMEV